jgi:hypothetical protein
MTASSLALGEYLRKISVDLRGASLREGARMLAQLIPFHGVVLGVLENS